MMPGETVQAQSWRWTVRGRSFDLRQKTLVMGIVNITPDSFSGEGNSINPAVAFARAEALLNDGADLLDLGAESSRPGRPETLTDDEEWARLEPVLTVLRREHPHAVISVDTFRGATAARALDAGADIINDIYALRRSPEIAGHCAAHGAGLILMHMQGDPETMQVNPAYENVLSDIRTALRQSMGTALEGGVPEDCIVVDPGIGFGKTLDHNVEILAGLEYLRLMQRPICVGASRKGFLGKLTGDTAGGDREAATIAAHCTAVLHGATVIRTHDVKAAVRSLAVIDAVRKQMDV